MELKYIKPILSVGPKKADRLSLRIDDSIIELESHMETFKLAHREYVERILENTSGDKEEMYIIIGGCNNYLKEVVGRVHDVLALQINFKYKR